MAHSSVIETLIDLSRQQSEEAAKRLGQAVQLSEQAKEKLDLLTSYREEYVSQLHHKMRQGVTIADHLNFQRFIQNLDRAVEQQRQAWTISQQAVEVERNEWQLCERKKLSYGTLARRAEEVAQRKENRLEQKRTDEQAARCRPALNRT